MLYLSMLLTYRNVITLAQREMVKAATFYTTRMSKTHSRLMVWKKQMIRRFSKHCAMAICVLSAFITINSATQINASPSTPNITLYWSFTAITGPIDQRTLITIQSDSVLYSGDKIKIMFEAQKQCYINIIFEGSGGEILLLYPQELEFLNHPPKLNKRVYIPNESDWFILDQKPGMETFYLLVSSEPMVELESQLKRYNSASPEGKDEVARSIVELISKHETFSRPLTADAEKPMLIGGTIRNISEQLITEKDLSKFAETITANDIFVRTYSIDHR